MDDESVKGMERSMADHGIRPLYHRASGGMVTIHEVGKRNQTKPKNEFSLFFYLKNLTLCV